MHVAERGTAIVLTYNSHPEGGKVVEDEIQQAGGKLLLAIRSSIHFHPNAISSSILSVAVQFPTPS
jgi:hypothetical protein